MPTYYEILEVSRESTLEEIRTAYRRLALTYHPDKNPGDRVAEDRFKQISEAYQVLADPEKRQLYDLYGDAGLAGLDLGGFEDIFSSFGEVFEDFFSFGRSRNRPDQPQPGADLRQPVVLTLEEAARGLDTSLSVERRVSCPRCQGDGAEPGCPRQTCSCCRGKGQVSQSQGLLKIFNTCPDCQGAGVIITSPCSACQGAGVINEKKQIQVHIPPGVDTGTRLRLRGEGEAGRHGAPPGDLYLEMCVAPHPIFTRKRQDLYYRSQISFVEAALGTEVEVPTLTASARLAIPPGTQPGASFRIPGLGLPGLRGKSAGDLLVVVDLQTPTQLSVQQKQLLQEFLRLKDTGGLDGFKGMGA
ncbi:MAG: molecular chaperone DnaJ [Deltaproteobacteria bacterium CG07_land_8_20_14_0_80_60_11]|nr:MAG: molecular chaperone DnaJ [Deltaproteobacteria bacterium CG07_land_8_20_14_0_80_60_11]